MTMGPTEGSSESLCHCGVDRRILSGELIRIADMLTVLAQDHTASHQQLRQSRALEGSVFRFFEKSDDQHVRRIRPPLPDPRLLRRIIHHRQLRARFFDGDLFADPAWDMLLDLAAARAEHKRVSVSSLCIASGVPPTTALRWIGQLTEQGLVQRMEDHTDRRRAFIALTDRAANDMARYFAAIGEDAVILA